MSWFYYFLVVFVVVMFSRGGGVSKFFEMVLEDVCSVNSILRGTPSLWKACCEILLLHPGRRLSSRDMTFQRPCLLSRVLLDFMPRLYSHFFLSFLCKLRVSFLKRWSSLSSWFSSLCFGFFFPFLGVSGDSQSGVC